MDINLIIENIINEFIRKNGNIFHAEKLFVAHTILRWAFENCSNDSELRFYIEQVKKYLRNEINLFWKDGKIRFSNIRG